VIQLELTWLIDVEREHGSEERDSLDADNKRDRRGYQCTADNRLGSSKRIRTERYPRFADTGRARRVQQWMG
jgi:hypothetical protein